MTEPRPGRLDFLHRQTFHRLAWMEWGDHGAPPVVCVHGLTRNGRDFDRLAAVLSRDHHVLCPDMPGRGRSDWLADPADYALPVYLAALSHLLARIGRPVAWVGTSMGGICGMALAAAAGTPLRRLVLNDIGPFVPSAAMAPIAARAGRAERFADMAAAASYLRHAHAGFGPLTDADWASLARHSVRPHPAGGLTPHHDPAIAVQFGTVAATDLRLDAWWRACRLPVLALRGADSDLLPRDTWRAMGDAGALLHEVAGAGHAPALMDGATIGVVARFLAPPGRAA